LQYFSRFEMGGIVAALGLLVVGVSLLAVPTDAPAAGARTRVDGVFAAASPSPSPHPSPAAPSAASPTPIPAAPLAISGPSHIAPWTTANYEVTFTGTGSRTVEVWWSGAAMGDWTWQRLEGHCDLTPTRDKLSGTAVDRIVIRLQLTPSGAPGGQLTFSGRDGGGQVYALAIVTVG
jgi:hypothetical protein